MSIVVNRFLLLAFVAAALGLAAQNLDNSTTNDPTAQPRSIGQDQQEEALPSGTSVNPPSSPCFARGPNERIVTSKEVKGKLIHKVAPKYPRKARRHGIQGTVVMCANIGKDGRINDLRAVSGPEELVPAALEAVKKWRYQPFELKGEVVEVETDIRV